MNVISRLEIRLAVTSVSISTFTLNSLFASTKLLNFSIKIHFALRIAPLIYIIVVVVST